MVSAPTTDVASPVSGVFFDFDEEPVVVVGLLVRVVVLETVFEEPLLPPLVLPSETFRTFSSDETVLLSPASLNSVVAQYGISAMLSS